MRRSVGRSGGLWKFLRGCCPGVDASSHRNPRNSGRHFDGKVEDLDVDSAVKQHSGCVFARPRKFAVYFLPWRCDNELSSRRPPPPPPSPSLRSHAVEKHDERKCTAWKWEGNKQAEKLKGEVKVNGAFRGRVSGRDSGGRECFKRPWFEFLPFFNVQGSARSRGAREGRRPREVQGSAKLKRAFIRKWQIELIKRETYLKCKCVNM